MRVFGAHKTPSSLPLSDVPRNLDYESGKVSLVADFAGAEQNRVPVYLINGTGKTFRMETVALEIPIVLEAYLGNGHWERAESHNAYGFLSTRKEESLPAGNFKVKKARLWEEGEPAKLRYALYQDGRAAIISESFEGRLPVGEIDKARHDLMAASLVPEPLRIRYFPEQTTRKEIREEWGNKLTLLRSFGPCYVDLLEAQRWAAAVHENPVSSRADRNLAIQLQLTLLEPWPAEYNVGRLFDHCRSVLIDREPGTEKLRSLCWRVLKEESEQSSKFKDPQLAKVAWETIQSGAPTQELEAATDFLCVNHIAKNFSPILEYKDHGKLLEHKNPYVRITAANQMLSQKTDQAVVLNHYLENKNEVGVFELIRVLHFDRLYYPYEKPNWELWESALDKDIDYASSQLSLLFESDNTSTNLRKFTQSSVLPESIKERLEAYCDTAPNGPKKQAIKRLLDDVNSTRNRVFRRPFL